MTDITAQDLQRLLVFFSKNTYRANNVDSICQAIMQRCILLADMDYTHSIINNIGGDLCAHYPTHLIVLENEKSKNPNTSESPPPLPRTTETIYESTYDASKLRDVIKGASIARCRSRFPLPAILYKGRHLCRSATLSGGPEIYGRSGLNLFSNSSAESMEDSLPEPVDEWFGPFSVLNDWPLFNKVRNQDIKLLKALNVGTIIDFMVEKKKVKFGLYVTSSEKVDKEKRYAEFNIVSLPYPGCEFFKEFRENNYQAKDLMFDWNQSHVDAEIGVPEDSISCQLRINWQQYQVWDLVLLTQNYLKLILKYLTDSNSGILIHCISGWDRTPLFVSLLRISLWADGAIHTSLNAFQILYFTIAYDWMLFGHDLADRLTKGEEILFFCFDFLKYIHDDEFSVHSRPSRSRQNVLRNDSDSQLDNAVMFDIDTGATIGSISSNLSSCSSLSQHSRDSQDNNPPAVFHISPSDNQDDSYMNGNVVSRPFHPSPNKETTTAHGSRSPLPPNRTSPVAVPVPGRRKRNESSSSGGSWQMISGTGSLRGSTTANAPVIDLGCRPLNETYPEQGHTSQDSSTTITEDEANSSCFQTRREKLQLLRGIFYNAYNTIGFRMKDNSEVSGLGQLLGNFAEKVGIISAQRTSL